MQDGLPKYLRTYQSETKKIIAKTRCENLESGNKYWLNKCDKLCILCKKEIGTLVHIIGKCDKFINAGNTNIEKEKDSINFVRQMLKNVLVNENYKMIKQLKKGISSK